MISHLYLCPYPEIIMEWANRLKCFTFVLQGSSTEQLSNLLIPSATKDDLFVCSDSADLANTTKGLLTDFLKNSYLISPFSTHTFKSKQGHFPSSLSEGASKVHCNSPMTVLA